MLPGFAKPGVCSGKIRNTIRFLRLNNLSELKGKPKIRMLYNKEKKTWEPENFGEYRRQMEEFEKQIKKLSS